MDQIPVAVDIGDRIAEKWQIVDRDDVGLKTVEIPDPAGGLVESIEPFPEQSEPVLGRGGLSFADQVDMGPHHFEGNNVDTRGQMGGQRKEVHGKTKIVFIFEKCHAFVSRRTQMIKGTPCQEQRFALTLLLAERKRF